MDRNFTVYRRLTTNLPAEQVFAAVEQALRMTVGGVIQRDHNSFQIQNGTNNLSFAFVGDLVATVTLTQPSPGIVDVSGTVTLKPNSLFWVCGIGALFCLWPLLAVNVLYFVLDPRNNYQMALDRIQLPESQASPQPVAAAYAPPSSPLSPPPFPQFK